MNPLDFVKYFVTLFVLLILIDLPYLQLNKSKFNNAVMKMTNGKGMANNYWSGMIVYIAIVTGILMLAIPRINMNQSMRGIFMDSLMYGGIFGITSYAIFDFTTRFIFNDWTIEIAIMDTVWGGILCTLATFLCVIIAKKLF